MARDRASIRIDMWGDDDWRDLPLGAQHLYMLLLSHPTLSYAGVAEWHPGKLAAMTADATIDTILRYGAVLESRYFIVVEPDTDEVLVRSFVKHDGLMKQPKLVVSMTTAYAAVASRKIRLVIAHEVQKMREREPDMRAWEVKQAQTVLAANAKPASELSPGLTLGLTPDLTPGFTPNGGQGLAEPTTTATATSSKEDIPALNSAPKRGSRLSQDWEPSSDDMKAIEEQCPGYDYRREHLNFVDYWIAQPGQKGVRVNWSSTWRGWMRRNYDRLPAHAKPTQQRKVKVFGNN